MGSFGERSQETAGGRWVPTASEVDWLKPEWPEFNDYTISMLACLAAEEEDKLQSAIHCTNILCIYFPVFGMVFATRMREMGISFHEIPIPAQREQMFLPESQVILSPHEIIIIVCTLIMLMFKNVSGVNYDKFLNTKIAALRALMGLPAGHASSGLKVMSLDVANFYKVRVGGNAVIRRKVIVYLMEFLPSASSFIGVALKYTLRVLAGTDMPQINQAVIAFQTSLEESEEPLPESTNSPNEWQIIDKDFLTNFGESLVPLPGSTSSHNEWQIIDVDFSSNFEESEEPLPDSTNPPNDTQGH